MNMAMISSEIPGFFASDEVLAKLMAICGKSTAAVYADVSSGLLPPPVEFEDSIGFIAAEIHAVTRARLAGKDDAAVRALVSELIAQRKRLA